MEAQIKVINNNWEHLNYYLLKVKEYPRDTDYWELIEILEGDSDPSSFIHKNSRKIIETKTSDLYPELFI
jgi:hypothetical protein